MGGPATPFHGEDMPRKAKSAPSVASSAKQNRERMAALASVAEEAGEWRPRREVLRKIEVVPTIFPQYDEQVRVMGHPIGRITLVHGPSTGGKTEFCLGLGLSFLKRGHFFAMADAERTTPDQWVRDTMREYADHPGFIALPVRTYEQVRVEIRKLCERVAKARDEGRLPDDTTGLIVVDSIRKLVPEKLFDNLKKALSDSASAKKVVKDKGVDGFGGRAGQMKAALNAAWVDELVPLMADTRMAIAIVTRETKMDDADDSVPFWEKREGRDFKTGGGAALFYDSSLSVRVKSQPVQVDKRLIGERKRLELWKTKLEWRTEQVPVAHFHTSNGADGAPRGFDVARDLLELGLDLDVLTLSGSWIKFGRKRWQGSEKAVAAMRKDEGLRADVEEECRRRFGGDK